MKAALSLGLLLLTVLAGASAFGQRSVTNAELEKFRQRRLQAEQDYRTNYERMGFPSPEELQRQIERSMSDRLALAERLAKEELERERIQIERERLEIERQNLALQREAASSGFTAGTPVFDSLYFGGGGYGFPGPYFGRPIRARSLGNFYNGFPPLSPYPVPVVPSPRVRINPSFGPGIRFPRR